MDTIPPPKTFDSSFFDWLELMAEKLDVKIVDRPGLSGQEVSGLERQLGSSIPAQIYTYYQHCSPWGIWREPEAVWQRVETEVRKHLQVTEPLLPIDINSQQRNYTVAIIYSPDRYEIVDITRYGVSTRYAGDLRVYFTKSVED